MRAALVLIRLLLPMLYAAAVRVGVNLPQLFHNHSLHIPSTSRSSYASPVLSTVIVFFTSSDSDIVSGSLLESK